MDNLINISIELEAFSWVIREAYGLCEVFRFNRLKSSCFLNFGHVVICA